MTRLAKPTASIARVVAEMSKLIRVEPTCIKCGCTEYSPCVNGFNEGCAWTFLNRQTNEGMCSACFERLSAKRGGRR